jgi:zinc protease
MFAAVEQELDSLRRVPPTAAEIERVREQQRREREVARKQNNWWLGTLQARLDYGDDVTSVFADDALIAALTPEKLAAVTKKYLDERNRARFVLLPEKKVP